MWCYNGNKYINKALAYKLHLNQQIIVRDDKYRNKTLMLRFPLQFALSFFGFPSLHKTQEMRTHVNANELYMAPHELKMPCFIQCNKYWQ